MAAPRTYDRIAWEDRFNRPTVAKLRAPLDAESKRLFDLARRSLLELDDVAEDFAWRGACWRWTVEYRTGLSDEPLAVLVPSPHDLQIAVPMELDLVRTLATRRMKRAVREGIELAQEAFDTRWAVWSVQSANLLDDVVDLIEIKLRHQAE